MTKIFLPSAGSTVIATGATDYHALGTADVLLNATEANLQTTWRTGGVFSNLYCRVQANLASTANSTLNYRVGSANGNQTISITKSVAGEFSDATHTDSVSAGNQVNYQTINGGGGNLTMAIMGIQFAPTTSTNTVNRLCCNGSITDTSLNTSYYNPVSGSLTLNTTEANAQFTNKISATLQNLYVFLSANTASVATLKSRVATANGNLSISIGSGVTGILEDTSNTDTLSSGNLINTVLNSTVTTTFTITNIAVEYLTTNNDTIYLAAKATGVAVNHGIPAGGSSTAISGLLFGSTSSGSETNSELKTGLAFTASNLQAFVISNGVTANTTVRFRVAVANGNQVVTYGSGITGYLEDTTNTDSVTASQEIDHQVTAGATGTSITFANIGMLAAYPAPASGRIFDFMPFFGVG